MPQPRRWRRGCALSWRPRRAAPRPRARRRRGPRASGTPCCARARRRRPRGPRRRPGARGAARARGGARTPRTPRPAAPGAPQPPRRRRSTRARTQSGPGWRLGAGMLQRARAAMPRRRRRRPPRRPQQLFRRGRGRLGGGGRDRAVRRSTLSCGKAGRARPCRARCALAAWPGASAAEWAPAAPAQGRSARSDECAAARAPGRPAAACARLRPGGFRGQHTAGRSAGLPAAQPSRQIVCGVCKYVWVEWLKQRQSAASHQAVGFVHPVLGCQGRVCSAVRLGCERQLL